MNFLHCLLRFVFMYCTEKNHQYIVPFKSHNNAHQSQLSDGVRTILKTYVNLGKHLHLFLK